MSPELIRLPLNDIGVTHGVLLTEQLRTFAGIPLLLERHLNRLESSARMLSIPVSISELRNAVLTVVKHNFSLISPKHDLRVSILVTPGIFDSTSPTLIVTTAELPFDQFARDYQFGIHLAVVETREIPDESIPRKIKHRNRIHYWLAEQQAKQFSPDARALLLDHHGNVCEATTASIAMVRAEEGIVAPPESAILGSISLATSLEMLAAAGQRIVRRKFTLDELQSADEILLFSSPMCVLPVSKLNGKEVGPGAKRAIFRALLNAWNEMVGFDLVKQSNAAASEG